MIPKSFCAADGVGVGLSDIGGAAGDDVAEDEDEDEELSMLARQEASSEDSVPVGEGVTHRFRSISLCFDSWATVGPVYLIAYLKELEFCLTA